MLHNGLPIVLLLIAFGILVFCHQRIQSSEEQEDSLGAPDWEWPLAQDLRVERMYRAHQRNPIGS